MSFDSFPTQNSLQIFYYTEPPKQKPTSRRNRTNTMPPDEHEYLVHDENFGTRPALTSSRAGDIDSASGGEDICKLHVYGCRCGDIAYEDDCLPQSEHQSEGVERGFQTSRGSKESPGQSAPIEGSSQECAVVIEDSQSELDASTEEDDYPREDDLGTPKHDRFDDAGLLNSDHLDTEGMEDAISSELVEGSESRVSGPWRGELSSTPSTPTPPTGSSFMEIGQPAQEANGDTLLAHVTMHQPQGSVDREAEKQGKLAHLESTSSNSSDGSDDGTDDVTRNHRTWLSRKRQRSLPGKRHSRMSSTTSKRHALGTQTCGHDSKICYSVDSSDSSDSSSGSSDRGCHLGSNKRRKSASRPRRSRSRSGADEEDEYEVEQILKARVYRRKLQYRVRWLGYEDDPAWYDASNFKNSPRKLREFHDDNPDSPGPPVRLEEWEKRWAGDRDADDHPDDNKPQRSHAGRGTLGIPEPCGYSLRRYSRLPVSTVQRQEARL